MDEKKRMQIIAENITYYRKQRGITQKELAKEVGITPSTMTDYMKLRSAPSFGVIQKLADFFGIKKSDIDSTFKEEKSAITSSTTPPNNLIEQISDKVVQLTEPNQKNVLRYSSELLDEQERGKTISDNVIDLYDTRKRISLPVPGKVSAGTGYWQEDDYDTMVDFYADEIPDKSKYDTVAVVVGHSMEPKIKNGDFLFIKLKDQVDLNKIGIFQVDGENYVKKLKSNCLQSLNPDYNDIQFTENMRTIGEVVDVYREK
ncbi:TPA: helix-turn-helix transcriptional regulator [Streptococcus suis]|nr:helix-turn-helix transcriptional regulator [Streptococcus suis]HEM3676446.1 helix-turn-helix transcriptional regulator [Streptococcus suis]